MKVNSSKSNPQLLPVRLVNDISSKAETGQSEPGTLFVDSVALEKACQAELQPDRESLKGGGKMLGGFGLLAAGLAAGCAALAAGSLFAMVGAAVVGTALMSEGFRVMGRSIEESEGPPGAHATRAALRSVQDNQELRMSLTRFLPFQTVHSVTDLPTSSYFRFQDPHFELTSDGEVDARFRGPEDWNSVGGITDSRIERFFVEGKSPSPEWKAVKGGFRYKNQELFKDEDGVTLESTNYNGQTHVLRIPTEKKSGSLCYERTTEGFRTS